MLCDPLHSVKPVGKGFSSILTEASSGFGAGTDFLFEVRAPLAGLHMPLNV